MVTPDPDPRPSRWGTARTSTPAWRRLRLAVLERDGYTCRIRGPKCTTYADTVDHVVPVSKGGPDTEANCRAACRSCHASRTGKQGRDARGYRKAPVEKHPGFLD